MNILLSVIIVIYLVGIGIFLKTYSHPKDFETVERERAYRLGYVLAICIWPIFMIQALWFRKKYKEIEGEEDL